MFIQERIKSYMGRVKEVTDLQNAPRLDKEASKRFVRSALWQTAQKKSQPSENADTGRNMFLGLSRAAFPAT